MKRRITEYLDLDTATLEWACNRCGQSLGPAAKNYKEGCRIADRDPREVWQPFIDASFNFSYNPGWARLVEFYCPRCGTMLEVEMLPPGHPITHDIELDLESLQRDATEPESGAS